MKTIGLPRFARALLTRIGSCRIHFIFQIKAGRFRKRYCSCNRFAGKIYLRDFQFIRNRFIVKMACLTVKDIKAALNACVTVHDWEMLTESIQIPEVILPFACLRKRLFTFYHHGFYYQRWLYLITSAEREVKDSRRSVMYQSCNFWQDWASKVCRFLVLFGYLTKWETN